MWNEYKNNLDFTLSKYKELCIAISNSDYVSLPVKDYFSANRPDNFILFRHDVDIKPERSLKMAQIENSFKIKSTYYFRKKPDVFCPNIIKQIEDLGHEIGYHYEVLDKARGDARKAVEIFEKELLEFRKICEINTICMHGNPLTKWNNKDLWNIYDFRDFGIIGEAYISIDYNDVIYFSDTGRTWNGRKYRIKDIAGNENVNSFDIKSTDNLIELINKGEVKRLCLLSHPGQWNDTYFSWITTWTIRSAKNIVKAQMTKIKL